MSAQTEVKEIAEPIREAYEAQLEGDYRECDDALKEAMSATRKRIDYKGGQSDE